MKESGIHFTKSNRSGDRFAGDTIGGPNHLPMPHAATGK
jgi:hypothetical protein